MNTLKISTRIIKYFYDVLLTVSILINVISFGNMNQTFSARNYEWKRSKRLNLVWLIDGVFYYSGKVLNKIFPKLFSANKNHCLDAWVYWYTRKHCLDSFCTDKIIMEQVNNGQIEFYF